MTMLIAIVFNILILLYFGSKVEIVYIFTDCLAKDPDISMSVGPSASVRRRRDGSKVRRKKGRAA